MTNLATPLFEPERHEPVTRLAWSEDAARAAIGRIADDALAVFTPERLWPAHPLDDAEHPDARYSMLYLGAGGVILALRQLAQRGYIDLHVSLSAGVAHQWLVYSRAGHFSEIVSVAAPATITAYRLPFWHYTTPLVGTAKAARWVLLGTFLYA